MIIDGLSTENTTPIAEVGSTSPTPKWCLLHNSKFHNPKECRLPILNSKTQIICFDCADDLAKDCPKPEEANREIHPNSNPFSSIHATFSTMMHIPLAMWKKINQKAEFLNLDNKKNKK